MTDIQNPTLKLIKDGFYYGDIINDSRQGKGIIINKQGRVYEGDWMNNLKHGYGYEKFPSGSYFEGKYINNKPEG